jgi:hypothetical protein
LLESLRHGHPPAIRLEVSAVKLGRLDAGEKPFGVDLAIEDLHSLLARRITATSVSTAGVVTHPLFDAWRRRLHSLGGLRVEPDIGPVHADAPRFTGMIVSAEVHSRSVG